jgi:hypothetical protein
MDSDFPPYTPEELERQVRRRASKSLARLGPFIDDPRRTPPGLRAPHLLGAWMKLPQTERFEHARGILKRQLFDELVKERGVILSDGTLL